MDTKLTSLAKKDALDNLVVSELVGDFINSGKPWDDYSDYDWSKDEEGHLKEGHLTEGAKVSTAGLGSACRDYFRTNENPSFDDFLKHYPQYEGITKGFYDVYARQQDQAPGGRVGRGASLPPPPVKKEFDRESASKDLLTVLSYFENAEEKAASLSARVEDKYEKLYDLAYMVSARKSNSRHGLICGDAGIGKTFSVNQAINKGLAESKLLLVEASGDACGKSMTSMVQFFYEHREGKLVLLDDSDGILVAKDQSINNALKAFLDPACKMFTMSSIINQKLNKIAKSRDRMAAMPMARESVVIDTSRLQENVVALYTSNGIKLGEEVISDEQRMFYENLEESIELRKPSKKRMLENYARTGLYTRLSEDGEDEGDEGTEDDDDWGDDEDDDIHLNEDVPMAFKFTSRTIFISNLKRSALSDAVASRFDIEEISLNNEEFIARLRQIIGSMNVNTEQVHSKEDAEWGKKVVYGLLGVLVEAYEKGADFGGQPVILGGKLQFRIVPQLVDKWIYQANKYSALTKETDRQKIEQAMLRKFINVYALPMLANLRDSKRTA